MIDSQSPKLRPIKDGRFRRWLTLLALQTTGRLYGAHTPVSTCVPISRHKIVKIQHQKPGEMSHLVEATTMQFVAAHTSLPVPKVHCTFERKGRGYVVMERIRGQMLCQELDLPEATLKTIFAQLRAALDELRSIEPPNMAVQSCIGGSLSDLRIAHTKNHRFGPFASIAEFHLWLRQYRQLPLTGRHWTEQEKSAVEKMIKSQDRGSWPPPVFTHGDLNPTNIIIRKGKLVGIIDWETAGWYPSYWEYTAAWCTAIISTGWRPYLERFMEAWPEELEMEITRNDYWGQI